MVDSKKSKSTFVIANPSRALADTFFLVKDKKLRLLKNRKKKVPGDIVTKLMMRKARIYRAFRLILSP
jgi:hypothetical protein